MVRETDSVCTSHGHFPQMCQFKKIIGRGKERGHYWTSYSYPTVFIRNAANLTQLLLKGSKIDSRS
jgi:hypothetical protein